MRQDGQVLMGRSAEYSSPFLYDNFDPIGIADRPQPSLRESFDATLKRFELIENVEKLIKKDVRGMIIGGSMSYGPFFNVRERYTPSDIGLIIVVDDRFLADRRSILNAQLIMSESDHFDLMNRREKFYDLYQNDLADIFSQRFWSKNKDFIVNMHFFPHEAFKRTYVTELENALQTEDDYIGTLRSYRTFDLKHETKAFNALDGSGFSLVPRKKEIDMEWIINTPTFAMNSRKLHLAFYYRLIFPGFSCFYDNFDIGSDMTRFHSLLNSRMRQEGKGLFRSTLSGVHPRTPIFSPGRYDIIS